MIRISQFSTGVTNELKAAIRAVKRAGATSIILDLRDNGGGLVFEAIGVASQFIPEGKTIYLYEEKGQRSASGQDGARWPGDRHADGDADQPRLGVGCRDYRRRAQRQRPLTA